MIMESDQSDCSQFSGSISRGSSASAWEGKISLAYNSFTPHRCLAQIMVSEAKSRITCMAMEGDIVYVGCENGGITVLQKGRVIACGFASSVVKALLIDHHKMYTAHQDGKIRMWRCTVRPVLKVSTTLPTLKAQLKSLMLSTSDKKVHGHQPRVKHVDAVTCVAVSAESEEDRFVYSGSWDKTVKVWRLGGRGEYECVESIDAHHDAVNAMVCGAHGLLFTGSADGAINVWRFGGWEWKFGNKKKNRGSAHHELIKGVRSGHESGAVNALALSGDESVLYSATSKCIEYWVIDDFSLQIRYEGSVWGHRRSVLCVATCFNLVCSGSADNTVRIWRRSKECGSDVSVTHSVVAVLQGHTGPVKCVGMNWSESLNSECSDDEESNYDDVGGFVVYSGSFDGSVRIWWVKGE